MENKFKILFLNLEYCTDINGAKTEYFTKFYRYIFLSRKIEKNTLDKLKNIIEKEDPDLICIVEIKNNRQIKELINEKYKFFDISSKYGPKSLSCKIPILRNNCNAFISKHKLNFKKNYFKNGAKKLMHEIILPNDTHVICTHFSLLNGGVRKKQFQEINEIVSKAKSAIVCGDFNIFKGLGELNDLLKNANLVLSHTDPTFPACSPKIQLDLFLCSKDLKTKTKVLRDKLSDHLPIVLELEL